MAETDFLAAMEVEMSRAISAESFDESAALLDLYASAVDREARTARDPAELSRLSARVSTHLSWAEARTGAFRAFASSELGRLKSLTLYHPK